jgi:hypothetical protein
MGDDSKQDIQIGVVSWSMPAGCATKVFPVVSIDHFFVNLLILL